MTNTLHQEAEATGYYLYCLARPECILELQRLEQRNLRGVDERYPVLSFVDAGVVAVIGQVTIAEFSEENLQTLSWLGDRAARHEAVVEQVMAVSPVLPVKFGAIYRTQTSIKQFLEKHHNDIEQALERLRDKAEWSVKGYLVEAEARRIIEATDPAVQAKMATLSSSPGARYLQQKQLKATIESALDARMALVANELQQALAAHAVDSSSLRLHASSVTGRSERMVFNGGFLLNSEALTDFQAALSEQQDIYKDIDLKLELRGPWPPYNFCPNLSAEQT